MTTTVETIASNPFALMMDPEAVFRAMAQSDRLARLSSRICRPLDKLVVPKTDTAASKADAEVDGEPDLPIEIPALIG
jgi:hypothetical protein